MDSQITAIARAPTADGFGHQSVGKMTEAGLLSGVVAQHSRLAADAEKRVVGMLHPIAAGSPRRGGGHLAHETAVNVLRRDSHIKRKSTSRILKLSTHSQIKCTANQWKSLIRYSHS
jgi:hypothetical protein